MQTDFPKNSIKPIPSLIAIQQELKIQKTHWNKFGSFNYRNASDILEAAKPLLAKWNAMLIMTDEIVQFGEFLALKSIITYVCGEDSITNVAYALIDTAKKGMDLSQITGSASSYARKTNLCGLFLIDDAIDPDSLPTMTGNGQTAVPPPPGTCPQGASSAVSGLHAAAGSASSAAGGLHSFCLSGPAAPFHSVPIRSHPRPVPLTKPIP